MNYFRDLSGLHDLLGALYENLALSAPLISMCREPKNMALANLLSSRTESLLLPWPLRWIEDPGEFRGKFTGVFQFSRLVLSNLHCPSGVETSLPAGGLNSNVDGEIGARVCLEYVVTIRSPFGKSMSVPSTRNLSLIRRSSF